MKYFLWNYNDGKFNFNGIAKVYNGLNLALYSSTNGFYKAFHTFYKGHSIKELGSICLGNFSKEEIIDIQEH